MLRETFAVRSPALALVSYRLSHASPRVSILNIAMTGTGVIAAQKGGCLFITERKGQRHTRIGSDRIEILNENPLSSLGRVTSLRSLAFHGFGVSRRTANFEGYFGGQDNFRVVPKSVHSEIIPVLLAVLCSHVRESSFERFEIG